MPSVTGSEYPPGATSHSRAVKSVSRADDATNSTSSTGPGQLEVVLQLRTGVDEHVVPALDRPLIIRPGQDRLLGLGRPAAGRVVAAQAGHGTLGVVVEPIGRLA